MRGLLLVYDCMVFADTTESVDEVICPRILSKFNQMITINRKEYEKTNFIFHRLGNLSSLMGTE